MLNVEISMVNQVFLALLLSKDLYEIHSMLMLKSVLQTT